MSIMSDDDLVVTISGPALSLLLFENARCHDKIGFLLGEIQIFVTKKVTDERPVENVKTHINIKSIVTHPLGCEAFFNTTGQLNQECLKEFLKDDLHKVVGWYHYRYRYQIELGSLRDKNLHIDLSQFFANLVKLQKKENFLFFFMVTNENETHATHKFKHLLYRREGKAFKPVSFRINNLGADATRPDGSDYKPTPKYTSCQTDTFDKVYAPLRTELKRLSGVEAVQLIEQNAESLLAKVIPEVHKTDQIVTELSEKLFEMRHAFHKQNFEKNKILNAEILRRQMQQCSMDVDSQPETQYPLSPSLIAKSELRSPESPLMFDPSKLSPSSSSIKTATTKTLRQESVEERMRDPISSERETNQMKYNIPRSPSPTFTKEWKSVLQRTAELESSGQASRSSFDRKNIRKSPDYNEKKS